MTRKNRRFALEFSLIYPVKEGYCDPDTLTRAAVAAEEEGFHSFLVWDHYMTPGGPNTLDAWVLLGFVAGKTSSIGLGTVVTPLERVKPFLLGSNSRSRQGGLL